MESKNSRIDRVLIQLRNAGASEAYKRQILEELYDFAYGKGKTIDEDYIDAHMGVGPSGVVCMAKYSGVVCSMCHNNVSFKIHVSEYEKLKELVKKDPRHAYLLMNGFPAGSIGVALWSEDEAMKFKARDMYNMYSKIRLYDTLEGYDESKKLIK